MMKVTTRLFAMAFVAAVVGCGPDGNKANVELIQDMMEQPAVKAQDFMPENREKLGNFAPPKGTYAQNRDTYLYAGDVQGAIKNLKNPHAVDTQFLEAGKRHFNNYCMVCHGEKGMGDGPVASKFSLVKPPSLMSDKVRTMADGQLFHIISEGQGTMGHYSNHMPFLKDRWAVVSYVRKLQKDSK